MFVVFEGEVDGDGVEYGGSSEGVWYFECLMKRNDQGIFPPC